MPQLVDGTCRHKSATHHNSLQYLRYTTLELDTSLKLCSPLHHQCGAKTRGGGEGGCCWGMELAVQGATCFCRAPPWIFPLRAFDGIGITSARMTTTSAMVYIAIRPAGVSSGVSVCTHTCMTPWDGNLGGGRVDKASASHQSAAWSLRRTPYWINPSSWAHGCCLATVLQLQIRCRSVWGLLFDCFNNSKRHY